MLLFLSRVLRWSQSEVEALSAQYLNDNEGGAQVVENAFVDLHTSQIAGVANVISRVQVKMIQIQEEWKQKF